MVKIFDRIYDSVSELASSTFQDLTGLLESTSANPQIETVGSQKNNKQPVISSAYTLLTDFVESPSNVVNNFNALWTQEGSKLSSQQNISAAVLLETLIDGTETLHQGAQHFVQKISLAEGEEYESKVLLGGVAAVLLLAGGGFATLNWMSRRNAEDKARQQREYPDQAIRVARMHLDYMKEAPANAKFAEAKRLYDHLESIVGKENLGEFFKLLPDYLEDESSSITKKLIQAIQLRASLQGIQLQYIEALKILEGILYLFEDETALAAFATDPRAAQLMLEVSFQMGRDNTGNLREASRIGIETCYTLVTKNNRGHLWDALLGDEAAQSLPEELQFLTGNLRAVLKSEVQGYVNGELDIFVTFVSTGTSLKQMGHFDEALLERLPDSFYSSLESMGGFELFDQIAWLLGPNSDVDLSRAVLDSYSEFISLIQNSSLPKKVKNLLIASVPQAGSHGFDVLKDVAGVVMVKLAIEDLRSNPESPIHANRLIQVLTERASLRHFEGRYGLEVWGARYREVLKKLLDMVQGDRIAIWQWESDSVREISFPPAAFQNLQRVVREQAKGEGIQSLGIILVPRPPESIFILRVREQTRLK